MKLLIVFLTVIAINWINIPVYSEEVAVPMTEEEIESEINEIVDEAIVEEIIEEEIVEAIEEVIEEPEEITEIDIPRDVFSRLRMAQSNINKWQKTLDTVMDKYQISLGNVSISKLEMKRLQQIIDSEFNLFLMSNDIVDIGYSETKDWEIIGRKAVKK